MRRGFWFLAGAGAGVYAMRRAQRAAEAVTPGGLRDRIAALSLGAHLLHAEIRAEMSVRETHLRERLGLGLHGHDGDDGRQLDGGRSLELTREATG